MLEKKKTICYFCSGGGCGLEVNVNNGGVVSITGDTEHPETKGLICVKGKAAAEILYAPDRLLYPLKRLGRRGDGSWQRISWDEALEITANKMQNLKAESGAESFAFHKGISHGTAGDMGNYFQRLANVFGSPNVSSNWHQCHAPRVLVEDYMLGGEAAPDLEKTKCIILWGINPQATNIRNHGYILAALKRGAKMIVVDPRKTNYARRADLHLSLRPGTDGALALGMLRVIVDDGLYNQTFVADNVLGFNELKKLLIDYPVEKAASITWVPVEKIQEAAHLYMESKPSAIIPGNALDHHSNTTQGIRAIVALMAISGNVNVPGGNVITESVSRLKAPVALHNVLTEGQREKRLGNNYLGARRNQKSNALSVMRAILDEKPYPVKGMMVLGSNPAMTLANGKMVEAALRKLDFLVVVDIFMTETAKLADIVLPACTFLEQCNYATYDISQEIKPINPGLLIYWSQIVSPVGESRSDWQIIRDLARKLGYENHFPWLNIDEAIDTELEPLKITSSMLKQHPEGIRVSIPEHPKKEFNTPSRKMEIYSKRLEDAGYGALPDYREPAESPFSSPTMAVNYPLVLTTGGKPVNYIHSQMRNIPSLHKLLPNNEALINPETAGKHAILDGAEVIIETLHGSIECKACVTSDIAPNIVHVYPGFTDSNANILTDDENRDPVFGTGPLRSLLCRVKCKIVHGDKYPAGQLVKSTL
jgi:anaerobic selenocysteine-containing dehydrogenase